MSVHAALRAARLLVYACAVALIVAPAPTLRAQNGAPNAPAAIVPNYEAAAQWTSQKVSKLVFDTTVAPRWLETGDRFWAGNHENNIYNNTWSEKHHGIKEVEKDGQITFEYDIERNSELAKNLKGKLLLIHGDSDNNVHPANTLRMADALIKANKRFDMFIVHGKRHAFADASAYVNWLRGDYFARHLLGSSADSVDIVELNRDQEQVGDKRPR